MLPTFVTRSTGNVSKKCRSSIIYDARVRYYEMRYKHYAAQARYTRVHEEETAKIQTAKKLVKISLRNGNGKKLHSPANGARKESCTHRILSVFYRTRLNSLKFKVKCNFRPHLAIEPDDRVKNKNKNKNKTRSGLTHPELFKQMHVPLRCAIGPPLVFRAS